MGRKQRQTQKQQKNRLVNLASGSNGSDRDAARETRQILQTETGWQDLELLFAKDKEDLPWVIAADLGRGETLREYLNLMELHPQAKKVLLDKASSCGDTALAAAAKKGRRDIVFSLIKAGSSPTKEALSEAIFKGHAALTLEVIPFILDDLPPGLNFPLPLRDYICQCCYRDRTNNQALSNASFFTIRRILASRVLDNGEISGVLVDATQFNRVVVVEAILDHVKKNNSQLQVCNILRSTLKQAAKQETRDFLELTRWHGRGSFLLLLENGADINTVANNRGETALAHALQTHDTEFAQVLLDRGACPDCCSSLGVPVLIGASYRGHGWVKEVEMLLDAGANVNAKSPSDENKTALHYACSQAYPAVVKLLLAAGADALAKTSQGISPLDLARKVDAREFSPRFYRYSNRERRNASVFNERGRDCAALIERYGILPHLFRSEEETTPFGLLQGMGTETSEGLMAHIGGYITNLK